MESQRVSKMDTTPGTGICDTHGIYLSWEKKLMVRMVAIDSVEVLLYPEREESCRVQRHQRLRCTIYTVLDFYMECSLS